VINKDLPRVPERFVKLSIDGRQVEAPEISTLLDVCKAHGIEIPTLCFLVNLTPANACRLCVVELDGSRALVPACSRRVEPGMVVQTSSERVRHSRKLVLELLASSVDLSLADKEVHRWMKEYGAEPERFGPLAPPVAEFERDRHQPGHHSPPDGARAETVHQPVKIHDEMYIRDYSKCVLCYRCVEACGADAQNTYAIAMAGRGFDARISTEHNVPLNESACVYCGNCIGVCPTGALMFKTEYDLRRKNEWKEEEQTVTRTVCPYCGVGCNLDLRVQDNQIVKVMSPSNHSVTHGHLCIKGRFGWSFTHSLDKSRNKGE
jgi:predicted molibdopterin-dependent oxidoreductase YjgC